MLALYILLVYTWSNKSTVQFTDKLQIRLHLRLEG